MNPLWLLRASRWARNPPPARRVWLVLCVIAACLALAGAERLFGDPGGVATESRLPFIAN